MMTKKIKIMMTAMVAIPVCVFTFWTGNVLSDSENKNTYEDEAGKTENTDEDEVAGELINESRGITYYTDYLTGGDYPDFRIGRNSSESFRFYVDDWHGTIEYLQDSDDNHTHDLRIMNSAGGTGANNIYFYTSGTKRMTIHDNGNIGIGTEDPDNELDVNGTIRAKQIVVETGWPDYVFKQDYKMMTLGNLEKFINENGHLPGMPTEDEVKNNGVSLGDNQALLLEKIEELTLHIIEQDKKISKLQKQVEKR